MYLSLEMFVINVSGIKSCLWTRCYAILNTYVLYMYHIHVLFLYVARYNARLYILNVLGINSMKLTLCHQLINSNIIYMNDLLSQGNRL